MELNIGSEQRKTTDIQTLLNNMQNKNAAPSINDLTNLNSAVSNERMNGVMDTPEQLAARELLRKELANIAGNPKNLERLNGKELKEVVIMIDANSLNPDGSRDVQLDNLLDNAISLLSPQQKSELMLNENLSQQLSAKLIL